MKKIIFCLLILPLLMAGGVYKWTDENGNIHFGDKPNNVKNLETVEIREQKTGTMVSDAQKAKYKYEARVQEAVDSYKSANQMPAALSGPSPLCKYNQSMLRHYENEWNNKRTRGYKQSERNYYEDKISLYKSEESINCN
jgi:hypothetical protein